MPIPRTFRKRTAPLAVAVAIAAFLTGLGTPALAQTPEDKAAARALATQASEALERQQFAQALDLVSRAEAIFHAPTHVLMIARSQVGLGKLVAAHETYLQLAREQLPADAPTAFKNAQQAAQAEATTVEARLASLRVTLIGAGQAKAEVKLDAEPVPAALIGVFRPVDPGKHDISVVVPGQPAVRSAVELQEGEKRDVTLTTPESVIAASPEPAIRETPAVAPHPSSTTPEGFMSRQRWWGVGIGGAGVVAVGIGAGLLAVSGSTQSQSDGLFASCNVQAGGCTGSQRRSIAQSDQNAANQKTEAAVTLIGGGAVVVMGAGLVLFGAPTPSTPVSGTAIMPYFTATDVGLRGQF
jgi:hypothetical protein